MSPMGDPAGYLPRVKQSRKRKGKVAPGFIPPNTVRRIPKPVPASQLGKSKPGTSFGGMRNALDTARKGVQKQRDELSLSNRMLLEKQNVASGKAKANSDAMSRQQKIMDEKRKRADV